MRIDVTDLFDDLFAFATIAYARFRFVPTEDEWSKLDEWDAFCASLSDSYFLTLVANRSHEITRQKIPIPDLKKRIIIRHEMGSDGQRGFNLPYEFPLFHHSSKRPCGLAGTLTIDGRSHISTSLCRPKHNLHLYLGKIPDAEFKLNRTPYDPTSESENCCYCEHGVETMFTGTVTKFYELQDGWVIREITLGDRLLRHEKSEPWWKSIENLVTINGDLFENVWRLAEPEIAR